MARPLRMVFPGALYHVMSRGNARTLIFLDERDYERLLDTSALEGLLAGYSGTDSGFAYQQFVNNRPMDRLDIGQMIRDDERFLGDESFLKDDRALAAQRVGRAIPRRETRPPALSLSRLFASTRSKHERNEQIRRAGVEFGYRTTDIARYVGLHPVTVGDILRAYRKQPDLKAGDTPAAELQHDETPVADQCGAPLAREHQNLGEGCVLDLTPKDWRG